MSHYFRRKTTEVKIGGLLLGSDNPIHIQSMTSTSTDDIPGSVNQAIRIIEAGGALVRFTAQGVREAENLYGIRSDLRRRGYFTPLVADIHFNSIAAFTAAGTVEKVRINPGNFVDSVRKFEEKEYSVKEYAEELEKIRGQFVPFLEICKRNGTAVRIGVNHGSLSDRIIFRYGNTPEGMVESCMEYLRVCVAEDFQNVVVSMKASSAKLMTAGVRQLVAAMDREDMHFPIHLGVTEAGDGEDGRIKSAVGIGTLLHEGIGDTVRVSLSEDPEKEITVARALVHYISGCDYSAVSSVSVPYTSPPFVIADYSKSTYFLPNPELLPDFIYRGENLPLEGNNDFRHFTTLKASSINAATINNLKNYPETIIILTANSHREHRATVALLRSEKMPNPVVIHRIYNETDAGLFRLKAAADCGYFFMEGLADGLFLQNAGNSLSSETVYTCAFGILQASGARISKTEYIACPGCGRTLFDLQTTLRRVKSATSHLKGLKIGVMGCIVNGPGEMADADYGYVGAGAGRISLYKGRECIKKNIQEEDAVEELLNIIEENSYP
ncbi:MAG: (E)-4-hydroxy-3-methylbut-2-enyl-diphosphate synthase [Dysgonamonadaceae bacterium]|jgi:(E)-4-hydroxy-3-methylbut-2-enyl-diphosphate synthase|nr:(E)-4-hydroxy-3-methylbut-2-enyl-diphosphate synthase [Dysgonamonadaceae bacterium]